MINFILEPCLQILILLPFVILLLRERSRKNFQRIAAFIVCYWVYQIALVLPKINSVFDFINSSWNWDGKIYGIIWAVIAYFLFRNQFRENDFFTLKQEKKNIKKSLIGAIGLVLLSIIVWYVLGKAKWDNETLLFQLSLPGIDEEMIFRGILLGLLSTALVDRIKILGSPGVLLTAILFGFMHALTIGRNYSIDFEPIYFLQTGFAGYIWGWITIKSRSILLAILSHNFSNFFGTLAIMIK